MQTSVHKLQLLDALELERDGNLLNAHRSDVGERRLNHYRAAVKDTVASTERALDAADRDRLVSLMRAADDALEPAAMPPWWLAP